MDLLLKRVSDKQTDKLIRLKKVIGKKENLKWKLFFCLDGLDFIIEYDWKKSKYKSY